MNSLIFIISAPSGAGKSSLLRALLARQSKLRHSVSYTTRAPRQGEIEGQDYRFISEQSFQRLIDEQGFVEYAQVHDHYYGTPKSELAKVSQGFDVACEIDWQGARLIRAYDRQAVSVFILPPSLQSLADRLHARGKDSEEVIARRLRRAQEEMDKACEYDFIVVNDDFNLALERLEHIYLASHFFNRATVDALSC